MMFSRLGPVFLTLMALGWFVATPVAAAPFRVALGPDPGSVDAPVLDTPGLRPLALALWEGLVGYDPVTGLAKLALAESWTQSDDGRTWTFQLRKARWSDGTPLIAADVAASWSRPGMAPGLALAQSTSDRQLVVTFVEPLPSVAVLAGVRWAVVAPGDGSRTSGPFRVENRTPGQSLSVVRNATYRDAASVKFDRVLFLFTDRPALADRLYQRRAADWVPGGTGSGTLRSPGWETTFLRFNLSLPPGNDPVVRQALVSVLDRDRIAAVVRADRAVALRTLVPTSASSRTPPGRRPAVKPLVGVPPFTLLHPVGESARRVAEEVAAQWTTALGVAVEPKEVSYADFLGDRQRGLYQVALSSWVGDYADPLTFLAAFRSDPAIEALVGRLETLPWGKERDKVVAETEARVLATGEVVPLLAPAVFHQIDPARWRGWTANPTDAHPWTGFGPRK